jgi:hypothetical protein
MLGQNHFADTKGNVLTFLHRILFCWATYWAPVEMFLVKTYKLQPHSPCTLVASNLNHLSKNKGRRLTMETYKPQSHLQLSTLLTPNLQQPPNWVPHYRKDVIHPSKIVCTYHSNCCG